jgi:hypothetical protein
MLRHQRYPLFPHEAALIMGVGSSYLPCWGHFHVE